eukprot:gb/GFBE01063500.1/.p1 GENE.gb/GFBE01063500.1/~~gb/GFBE01063500.1/.p1  ORF type:complete len:450 (+),score=59.79 gb/GFBE01063500.1/:1-1350(+)
MSPPEPPRCSEPESSSGTLGLAPSLLGRTTLPLGKVPEKVAEDLESQLSPLESQLSPQSMESQTFGKMKSLRSEQTLGTVQSADCQEAVGKMKSLHSEQTMDSRDAVRKMISLNISNPEILRATRAAVPLRCFGKLLRVHEAGTDSLYHLSYNTDRIQEFWSHSWHGCVWHKIAVLLVLKNGPPAVLAGILGSLLAAVLTCIGVPFPHLTATFADGTYQCGPWCLAFGSVFSLTVFALWRPRHSVFFDRVCIEQQDLKLKMEGIVNIGAFLKRSASMLVLWDPTYVSRLWCVFEIAAFLQSNRDQKHKPLIVRPVFLGPSTLLVHATTFCCYVTLLDTPGKHYGAVFPCFGFFAAALLVHAFRVHHRSLLLMKVQLDNFSLQKAECHCCTMGHVQHGSGQRAVCDRELVKTCIRSWFGKVTHFEAQVREQLYVTMESQLGQHAFPYWRL